MDFAAGYYHTEKLDLCKGYWNPQRKIGGSHAFFKISTKMLTSGDFCERKEKIPLHRFPYNFPLHIQGQTEF